MTEATSQNKPPRIWRWLMKAQNPFMKWLLRSPLHGVVSGIYMLITFTGRKSGTIYTTPVQYHQEGATLYVVTSEGYVWWKNLRGGADVRLHLRGEPVEAWAETTTDSQTLRHMVTSIYPAMADDRVADFVPGKVGITIQLKDAT